jgi:biotin carboxyl carrier protein
MRFEVEIGDRVRSVEVLPQPDGGPPYRVVVDGRTRVVEAVRVSADEWSLLVSDDNGRLRRSVDADISAPPIGGSGAAIDGALEVRVGAHRIAVNLRNGEGRRERPNAAASGAGPQRVTAPMPGKVVRLLIKAGDAIAARQGLVVIEAMKMENELRAARAGRVREVLVTEGQSVEAGTPLVIVE